MSERSEYGFSESPESVEVESSQLPTLYDAMSTMPCLRGHVWRSAQKSRRSQSNLSNLKLHPPGDTPRTWHGDCLFVITVVIVTVLSGRVSLAFVK